MLIFIVLKYDVMGYDTYVPSDAQLHSCAVSIVQLMPMSRDVYLIGKGGLYMDANEYRMINMEIQGNPSVMELARKAAKENLSYAKFDYYDGIENSDIYIETLKKEENYRPVSFGYKLLNGKTVYRQYIIDISDAETLKLLADIFNDYDYKIGSTPLLNNSFRTEFDSIMCESNFKYDTIKITSDMQAKITETYQAEYTKLTLDTVMNTIPVGTIEFIRDIDSDASPTPYMNYDIYTGRLYVYPQFKNTIALLKDYGFDMEEKLTAEDVEKISVTKNYDESTLSNNNYIYSGGYYYNTNYVSSQTTEQITEEYTDKEQIQQILDNAINSSFSWQISSYADYFDYQYTIEITSDNDNSAQHYYVFVKDHKPDFIK